MSVENACLPGTPDINFCYKGKEGWIEVKVVDHWPVRPTTTLSVAKFSPQQRLFFRLGATAGRSVWLVIYSKKEKEYLVLAGLDAMVIDQRTKAHAFELGHVAKNVHGLIEQLLDTLS